MNFNVSLCYKAFSFLKGLFWKNENIIYINSNKKRQGKEIIDAITGTMKYKWLVCETDAKSPLKLYNIHLLKMEKHLYDIYRNSSDSGELIYSGFVSPMFSVYDGYRIGDARKITFIDLDSLNSKP